MYDKLLNGLRRGGEADSVHQASVLAVEIQSAVAFLLLVFLAGRFISIHVSIILTLATLLLMRGRILTFGVFTENDDRFQTLLHYLVVCLALSFALVGWSI